MICILVGFDKNLYSFLNEGGCCQCKFLKKKTTQKPTQIQTDFNSSIEEFETVTLHFPLQHPLFSVKPLVYC